MTGRRLFAAFMLFLRSLSLAEDCNENDVLPTEHTCPDNATYVFAANHGASCFLPCRIPEAAGFTWLNCSRLDSFSPARYRSRAYFIQQVEGRTCLQCRTSDGRSARFVVRIGGGGSRDSGPVSFASAQRSTTLRPAKDGRYPLSVQLRNVSTSRASYFRFRLESDSAVLIECRFHPFCDFVANFPHKGSCESNGSLLRQKFSYQRGPNWQQLHRLHFQADIRLSGSLIGERLQLSVCSCGRNGTCHPKTEQRRFVHLRNSCSPFLLLSFVLASGFASGLFALLLRTLCGRELRVAGAAAGPATYFLIHGKASEAGGDLLHRFLGSAGMRPHRQLAGAAEAASLSACIANSDVQVVLLDKDCLRDTRFVCALHFLRCRGRGRHFYVVQSAPSRLGGGAEASELADWLQKDRRRREVLDWPAWKHRLVELWLARQVCLCARLAASSRYEQK